MVHWCTTGFASGPEFLLDIIWQPTTTPKLFIIQNWISMVSCFRQPIIHCAKLIAVVTNHVPCVHVIWIIFYLLHSCVQPFVNKGMSCSLLPNLSSFHNTSDTWIFDWMHIFCHHPESIFFSFQRHIYFATWTMHDCIRNCYSLYLASIFSLLVFVTVRTDLWDENPWCLQCCNVPQLRDFWFLHCFAGFEVLFQTGSNRAASAAWLSNPRD